MSNVISYVCHDNLFIRFQVLGFLCILYTGSTIGKLQCERKCDVRWMTM